MGLAVSLIGLGGFEACTTTPQQSERSASHESAAPVDAKSAPQAAPNESHSWPDCIIWLPGAEEAWEEAFPDNGRYRKAHPGDFSFPAWVFKNRGGPAIPNTCISGIDINRDRVWRDFAVIVVDTTRSDPERFGLVIFTAPPKRGQSYTHVWLYEQKDLSKCELSTYRGTQPLLSEYHDDGSSVMYVLGWDPARRKYHASHARQ
jgi:hypothetical protein